MSVSMMPGFLKRKKIFIPLIIILIIFGRWLWFEGNRLHDLYTGKTPMYTVSVGFRAAGEQIDIKKHIPCVKVFHGEFLPYLFRPWDWHNRPFKYYARDRSVGAELKDGRNVLISLPGLCQKKWEVDKDNPDTMLLPDNFLPIIGVADDARDPQVLKLIFSRSYYYSTTNDIRITSYQIQRTKPGHFPSFVGDFTWLRNSDPGSAAADSSGSFYFDEVNLYGVPLEIFKKNNPEFSLEVNEIKEPLALYERPDFIPPKSLNIPRTIGMELFSLPFQNLLEETDPYVKDVSYDQVIPVDSSGDRLTFNLEERGYLMLYRGLAGSPFLIKRSRDPEDPRPVGRQRVSKYELNVRDKVVLLTLGERIKTPNGNRYKQPFYYDPKTNHVYWLSYRNVDFPKI